jgi:ferredoxin
VTRLDPSWFPERPEGVDVDVRIDPDRCQGHAICFMLAAEVFDVDDEGRGWVIEPHPAAQQAAQARTAAARCPEGAVQIDDDGVEAPPDK